MSVDRQTITWVLGIVAVTTAFLLVHTRSQFRHLGEVSAAIERERAELAIGQNSPQAIAQLRQSVAALASRIGDYDARIPGQASLGPFLEDLARFVDARHIVQDAIEPGKPVEANGVVTLPITLKLRGPFQSIFGFVQDIEQMKRVTRVERFATMADEKAPGEVSVELRLQTFYRVSSHG